MNQELQFAKTIESVRKLAKSQNNCVSTEQVESAFSAIGMGPEQLELVYEYLKNKKIGIGEPVDLDEYLSGDDVDYLKMYLEELEELENFTDGQKLAYTMGAMAGEADAQLKLVECYLKEVVEIAKLYAGQGVLLEDLIGEGNVSLTICVTMLGCLEHPSEAEGMIAKMIMDGMEKFMEENVASYQADKAVADKVNEISDMAKELAEAVQHKITVEELAAETSLTEDEIKDAIRMSGNQIEYFEGENR